MHKSPNPNASGLKHKTEISQWPFFRGRENHELSMQNDSEKQTGSDRLQRFLFDGTTVRGEITRIEETCRDILGKHDYPESIRALLGELLAACALLAATVKLDGTLSVEIRGNGAVSLLMAESNPGSHERAQQLRGIARFDREATLAANDTSLPVLVGDGRVIITMDPKSGRRYQGIVSLDRETIAGCVESYFRQSEQLPTRLWLATDGQRAAGLLLQKLPREANIEDEDSDAWNRIIHLADTLTDTELIDLDMNRILHRLFHEEQVRTFDPAPLAFACTCSRARFGKALHQLGEAELRDILAEQGEIRTQCHFCNTTYVFSAAQTEALIEDPDAEPPTMH